ncbi:Uncharacterised protein [Legionella pneumophila]|nr:Uncharacterised protein [Legionella pneumophila]
MTANKMKKPWSTAENLVFEPAWILMDVLTMTDVTGIPPTKPDVILPKP